MLKGLSRIFVLLFLMMSMLSAASAFETIKITKESTALDLSKAVEIYRNQGETFQISTAPGTDGIVRRIEVQANDSRSTGDWAAFSLANPTDEQIDRLIVAPHFRLVGSGFIWPDLGSTRITSITPSEGFALDRQASEDADIFLVTLNPGSVITFVAELASPNLPQVYVWEPNAYKDTVNSYTLYRGILLGIAGLLALFLTILFVVKGTSLFPATAAMAWAVLAYICVDFGFWNKLIEITPGNEQVWRAGTEVALAATLVIFLFTYLNLNRWHDNFSYGALTWILGLGILSGVAIFDPPIASGIARFSFALTVIAGIVLIGFFSFRSYDRAIMLIPTWLLLLVWLLGSWLTVSGILANDIVQPALGGGLVLIVLLIGFTVMQHAFSGGALQQGLFSDVERQALAIIGSGDIVWDWDVPRDRVVTTPDLTNFLGASASSLHGAVRNWLPTLHADDRDRFRTTLDVILENRRGRISQTFRLRANDGHYYWYTLKARPDTLSRLSADQFGLILVSEVEPARIAAFAEAVKQAIRAPIAFAKREIVLTASLGLITWTSGSTASPEDLVKDAELAMFQAKRFGGDRIEPFRPAFRAAEQPQKVTLLRSMISMAHDLGLSVVTEGIENESDALQLRQMGSRR
eukprot:gene10545-12931_t